MKKLKYMAMLASSTVLLSASCVVDFITDYVHLDYVHEITLFVDPFWMFWWLN
jgi:hypothetical protein